MIYTASYLLTQNASRDILRDAALAVSGSEIADVGPRADVLARHPGEPVRDLGEAALLPGLVNGHTHVPMSCLRGYADDLALMSWLQDHIFPAEAKLTPEDIRDAARLSFLELVRFGCTAFYDMYMNENAVGEAAAEVGIRGLLGESLTQFVPAINGATLDDIFAKARDTAARYACHPTLRAAINPHAIYTTNPDLLRRCRDFADELGIPLGIHMSETRTETEGCLKAHGKRPLAYCRDLGLLKPDTSLFHMVDVDDEDLDIAAECGCAIVHNPASNMKLASGFAPLAAMAARGIPVSIGTDGPASNNAQNMFRETYLAALLQKGFRADPLQVPAQQALDMATLGGAAALHEPRIGALEPGRQADFIALDLSWPNLQPVHNIVSNLVYAASGAENRLTVVAGRELYRDGQFLTADYTDALARIRRKAAP
jgi:5-methylthioadenosine/S-adenosylhomocysteine deaminase